MFCQLVPDVMSVPEWQLVQLLSEGALEYPPPGPDVLLKLKYETDNNAAMKTKCTILRIIKTKKQSYIFHADSSLKSCL